MFEADFEDMCDNKFPLMLMGGRVEGLAQNLEQKFLKQNIQTWKVLKIIGREQPLVQNWNL